MKINQTQMTLLGVLSKALTGTEYTIPADTDWTALFAESKAQAVIPLAFSCIADQCTDEEVLRKWKSATMRSLRNNVNVQMQHDALHQLLTDHDIPYCIIKGCAAARDYPDPLLRAMGDVDFLVPAAFWEKTEQLLLDNGFTTSGEEHPFHLAFHKKGISMEMHREPFGIKGAQEESLLKLVPELIENSTIVRCNEASFRMPDAFGHGIVILLHAYRHLTSSGIGVRHLCDWAVFVSRFTDKEFTDIFQEHFQTLGVWKLAQVFATTAHRYLSIPYQQWMGPVDEQVCQMLMLDILNGGNFGQAGADRSAQNLSIYEDGEQLSNGGNITQLLRGLNKTAVKRYPRLMKIRFFRPFGWLILGVRYVFRVLAGKRKAAPGDTMKMITMRKKLYRQLAVFDKA